MAEYSASIQTDAHPEGQSLVLKTGAITIIAGPNGVGKSSLLDEIHRQFPSQQQSEMFSGHRQIAFANDEVNQLSGLTVENLFEQFRMTPQNVSRYRNTWEDQHLKAVIRRVTNHHLQGNEVIIREVENELGIAEAKEKNPRLLDTLNQIFAHSGLPIRIELHEGTLRVARGADRYALPKLSDGERAALLLVGAVLVLPYGTMILVDEPERHLNPSISGALIAATVRARPDLAFVFATHDLPLIDWLKPEAIIYIKDSVMLSPQPERRRYALEILSPDDGLDENLRYSLLGSRKALLLVEGQLGSYDRALYKLLYPSWHVVPRGGWEAVTTGVRALKATDSYNWLIAAGIIDGDGRDAAERATLASETIFCLPCPTIENLFLLPQAVGAVAHAIFAAKGGRSAAERLAEAEAAIKPTLIAERERIVAAWMVWKIQRVLSSAKPSVKSILEGQMEVSRIDFANIRQDAEAKFEDAVANIEGWSLLQFIPIKSSVYWQKLSNAVGVTGSSEYKSTLLWQMQSRSIVGIAALDAVQSIAPQLPLVP